MTRRPMILCLVLLLSLAAAPIAAVVTDAPAMADNGNSNGNGNGNGKKDKDKEEGKDKEKKEKDRDTGRGNGNSAVEPAAPYRVDVTCDPDEAAGETTCTFTGVTPEGAKDVGHVDLPAAEICTAVLGGDAEYVDPDPNTGVVGYKSRGDSGVFTLVLEGDVTTGGAATYWVKAGDGVFPASGPGLVCAADQPSAAAAPTAIVVTGSLQTPVATETAASGAISVHAYACPADADPATFDWFAACEPGVSGVRFSLFAAAPSDPEPMDDGATQASGEVRFDELTPGSYEVDAPDTVWCHAESDSVNEHGELVVTDGAEVSVWIFLCGNGAPTRPATPALAAG